MPLHKFTAWQNEVRELGEAREWLDHIGKRGRGGDVLRISPAHCGAPQITLAGQYTEGGKNYWESPKEFNEALKTVIIARFTELASEAISLMEKQAAATLVSAEQEIAAVQAELDSAKMLAA